MDKAQLSLTLGNLESTMNKQDIIDEMRVLPSIDPQFEISRRILFIQNQLISSGARTLVLGISGGVDSSTCGRLAQLAVNDLNEKNSGSHYQFAAVRLPYGTQKDEDDAQVSLSFIKPNTVSYTHLTLPTRKLV